ncbi:MAG: phosphoribosyltransferase family protein [Sulfuricurvum sp.]|uniref:phosphoribosyltransferase n=1 Tax=Sulfuricurvum sp. TaxID=2025608 RepID=UPI00262A917E|nr:phosphoribosyltransferase family protein [Sulfuricurvum sp.]MDD5159233.1 phosphoribosyltransferase family protein [Sulfuricurvum sp.]
MIAYKYEHFKNDLQHLIVLCEPFRADTIIAVARGGMTLAHALSMALDIRNLQSIRIESYDGECQRESVSISGQCDLCESKRVLVVDDIVDSGQTLFSLMPLLREQNPSCDFRTVALFTKTTALLQPDFSLHEARDWIDFFWERDFLKSDSI